MARRASRRSRRIIVFVLLICNHVQQMGVGSDKFGVTCATVYGLQSPVRAKCTSHMLTAGAEGHSSSRVQREWYGYIDIRYDYIPNRATIRRYTYHNHDNKLNLVLMFSDWEDTDVQQSLSRVSC